MANIRRRVVVTGMGVLCPLGSNMKESWNNLIMGKSAVTKLEGYEYDKLPCQVAAFVKENGKNLDFTKHFKKTELKTMSRATVYALLATEQAMNDANLSDKIAADSTKLRSGVAVGMGMVDLVDICETNRSFAKGYKHVSPFFVPRILPNMAAGQISIKYGLRGPNHAVSTACATGAHAIGDSFKFVRDGDADIMICGGTEACISPLSIAAFCRLRALSTSFNDSPDKASRPFDSKRDGFVMGEGSAILVLEELKHAVNRKARIYAEILGYGLSGDAAHLTAPSSDGMGARLAMKRAMECANIDVRDVTYINAHATSTPLGDGIEVKAVKQLFGDHSRNLAISSTKGAHGHLLGAAGNLETAFVIKAVKEGILPPTINLEIPEDRDLNFVPISSQRWECHNKKVALKNAFGFGGTNACLCISEYLN